MLWLIADTHFGHANIIEYEKRPFASAEEMDNTLIRNWNDVVAPEDRVLHLGDFALARIDRVQELLGILNGRKSLVLGNHDIGRSDKRWMELGFESVFDSITIDRFILTHAPLDKVEEGMFNVHGHVHSHALSSSQHFCVSVENIDYKPVAFHTAYLMRSRQ